MTDLQQLFADQLAITDPITPEMAAAMQSRCDERSSKHWLTDRIENGTIIGRKLVFFMFEDDNKLRMLEAVDDELDTVLASLMYVRSSGVYPVFRHKHSD